MNTKKLRILDYEALVRLNDSSIHAGRLRNLPRESLAAAPQRRYPINLWLPRRRGSQEEVRLSVVMDAAGQSVWLDVSPQEFDAIPQVDVLFDIWEGAMCAGNPPPAP
ncbi:MAG: hypothetical protein HY680_02455 [Chloroflexi bacterium]|nr:hypothetical protein [Chloroflexota bacterium]